jgi:hypothetical protein
MTEDGSQLAREQWLVRQRALTTEKQRVQRGKKAPGKPDCLCFVLFVSSWVHFEITKRALGERATGSRARPLKQTFGQAAR